MARRVETFRAIFYGAGMTSDITFRRIGIVGTGRVASAFALGLAGCSVEPVMMWGRSAERLLALTGPGGPVAATDLAQITQLCDVIVIAVADDAIDAVVADLALSGPAPFAFHVSGRSGVAPLAPLAGQGALTAAVHPVMTFTGHPAHEVERMAGARFAVTASSDQALALAYRVVACLKGLPSIFPRRSGRSITRPCAMRPIIWSPCWPDRSGLWRRRG
jgi:predicted short-subunit dehydrogenase-like oxidoreductase (DUF2520 family)